MAFDGTARHRREMLVKTLVNKSLAMTDDSFQDLSTKVDDLITLCARIKQENRMLKDSQSSWHSERQQLLASNREAKIRLQSVLNRLKAMGSRG